MKGKETVNKGRRIAGCIFLSLCILFAVYCAVVMSCRLSTAPSAKHFAYVKRFLAEFGVICLLSVPTLDIGFKMFTWRRNRAAAAVGIALRVVTWAVCALFIVLGAAIMITGAISNATPADNVCVLGLAIDGDELPRDLTNRLDKAVAYKATYPDTVFIISGGNADSVDESEAAYMARYLTAHGIDNDGLIMEPYARTTVENFANTAAFVDKEQALGVITNDYHMFRASKIAKKQGYTVIVCIPAPSAPLLYLENVVWESVCSISETLHGNMAY